MAMQLGDVAIIGAGIFGLCRNPDARAAVAGEKVVAHHDPIGFAHFDPLLAIVDQQVALGHTTAAVQKLDARAIAAPDQIVAHRHMA